MQLYIFAFVVFLAFSRKNTRVKKVRSLLPKYQQEKAGKCCATNMSSHRNLGLVLKKFLYFLEQNKYDYFEASFKEKIHSIICSELAEKETLEILSEYSFFFEMVGSKEFFATAILMGANYEFPALFQFGKEPTLRPNPCKNLEFSKALDDFCWHLSWENNFRKTYREIVREQFELWRGSACTRCGQKMSDFMSLVFDSDMVSDRLFVRLAVAAFHIAERSFFYEGLDQSVQKCSVKTRQSWVQLKTIVFDSSEQIISENEQEVIVCGFSSALASATAFFSSS